MINNPDSMFDSIPRIERGIQQRRPVMKIKTVKALVITLICGCFLIPACGEDKAEKTQGFTQSLEEEQEEASEALETFEKASEVLENAEKAK